MRFVTWSARVVVFLLGMAAVAAHRQYWIHRSSGDARTHAVLIGASIGQEWALSGWAQRVGEARFTAESVAAWQFDKSAVVEEVSMRPRVRFRPGRSWALSVLRPPRRPDVVVVKECSSYFPGDQAAYSRLVQRWATRLRDGGSRVALATVVPVTRRRSMSEPGKQEGVAEYNRWIRDYASREALPVLDLEAAVRGADSYLRDEFAAEDGSHLNHGAYTVLDRVLRDFLSSEFAEESFSPAGGPRSHSR